MSKSASKTLSVDDLERLALESVAGNSPALSSIASRVPRVAGRVLEWFRGSLRDERKKWFVAALLQVKPDAARPLTHELIGAAMSECDPRRNREFVRPLVGHLSWPDAVSILLHLADGASENEKAGIARTAYWIRVDIGETNRASTIALNSWMVAEFVGTKDIVTQRCLIAGMSFDPEQLSQDSRTLRDAAIQKARTSPDDYVRHRLAIQLGEAGGPYMPLVTNEDEPR